MKTCLNTGGKLVQELKQRGTTLTRELEYVSLHPPPPSSPLLHIPCALASTGRA